MPDRKRNTWAYRQEAEAVRRAGTVCPCGRPLDPDIPRDRPDASSADHVIPVALGGPLTGAPMIAMHRVCNMRRGTRSLTPEVVAELRARPLQWDTPPTRPATPRHSREW